MVARKDLKVVLLGDCGRLFSLGVGKTSLLRSFMGMDIQAVLAPSIGVDFFKKTLQIVDIGKVKVQFWDTAGQEKYKSLSTIHARGTNF